jgi:hypothetical protein
MIGRWSADLIKASGHARRTHRPHGWLQPMTAATTEQNPLQSGRRPWMDPPNKALPPQG